MGLAKNSTSQLRAVPVWMMPRLNVLFAKPKKMLRLIRLNGRLSKPVMREIVLCSRLKKFLRMMVRRSLTILKPMSNLK
jgi:hypothetical protein